MSNCVPKWHAKFQWLYVLSCKVMGTDPTKYLSMCLILFRSSCIEVNGTRPRITMCTQCTCIGLSFQGGPAASLGENTHTKPTQGQKEDRVLCGSGPPASLYAMARASGPEWGAGPAPWECSCCRVSMGQAHSSSMRQTSPADAFHSAQGTKIL